MNSNSERYQITFVKLRSGEWIAEYDRREPIIIDLAMSGVKQLKERDEKNVDAGSGANLRS